MFRSNDPDTTYSEAKRNRMPMQSIVLIACFLGAVVFFVFIMIYTSTYTPPASPSSKATYPGAVELIIDPEVPLAAKIPGTLNARDVLGYTDAGSNLIVHMSATDINRGNLLLVNYENVYDIPDDIDLVKVVDTEVTSIAVQTKDFRLLRPVIEPLDEMMAAFIAETGNDAVTLISAFRTYETQRIILEGRRCSYTALPGYSEHHTGLVIDFGINDGSEYSEFTGTGSTAWFKQHSYKYGFIYRFPAHKSHITNIPNEPWHFRYVGLPHSFIMYHNNWALEEYIEVLREYTFERPFKAGYDGVGYEIYFTTDSNVPIPYNSQFEISGNNIDGFIVTLTHPTPP